MAYALHIELENSKIPIDEWIATIESIDGARISSEDSKTIKPSTGEEIVIISNPGDVEVLFTNGGILGFRKNATWQSCIRFSNGRASFKASEDIESPQNPVHIVATKAAKQLSAKIVGDEGEVYRW